MKTPAGRGRQEPVLTHKRMVAKLGTSLLTGGKGRLDLEVMASLVGQVARLMEEGVEVIVVTSGSIAAGRLYLGLTEERKDITFRQVAAAAGQSHLMHSYQDLFGWHGLKVAQVLVTRSDLVDRQGYLNVRNTLEALLELKVVPILNENDAVGVEEIKGARFGDNDNLSAMVANLVDADLLAILTEVAGLCTADPRLDRNARLIPVVEKIDAEIERLAEGASPGGTGGMATKLQAARLATSSGVATVIAYGREPEVLVRLARGEAVGTLFPPVTTHLESRQRWMLSGLTTRGRLVVDAGAARAIKENHKSLLPAGVLSLEGDFQRGEVVRMCDAQGKELGCGLANYSSADLARIRGLHSDKILDTLGYEYGSEAVHRNNLVIL